MFAPVSQILSRIGQADTLHISVRDISTPELMFSNKIRKYLKVKNHLRLFLGALRKSYKQYKEAEKLLI